MKTHESIFYQKVCFMLRKLNATDFITNAFDYVSVSQTWLFFPVIIRLACASVIMGNYNEIILTTCEIWSSNCQYKLYCPLRWYILYYGKYDVSDKPAASVFYPEHVGNMWRRNFGSLYEAASGHFPYRVVVKM